MAYYGTLHNPHTDWHSSMSGLGDDAATFASLSASALAAFAGSGAPAAVVTITPSNQLQVITQSSSANASSYYDQMVELANAGQYVYVALFDHAKSNTPDGRVDETFTGVGVTQQVIQTVKDVVYSPWVIAIGAGALLAFVYWDKRKKRRRRR